MNDRHDMRRAFGNADASFASAVNRTLDKLNAEEELPVKTTRYTLAVALAGLLILATVAYAAAGEWGLTDYFKRFLAPDSIPAVNEIANAPINKSGGETDKIKLTVREAVFDGECVYIVARAEAPEGTLLTSHSDGNARLGDLLGAFEGAEGSIAEYAQANAMSIQPAQLAAKYAVNGNDFYLNGSYSESESANARVYVLIGAYMGEDTDALDLEIECLLSNEAHTSLACTLNKAGSAQMSTGSSACAIEFNDIGVRMERATFALTPMGMYVYMYYSVTDPEAYALTDEGLWFELIDADGERLPTGALAGSAGFLAAENLYYQVESYAVAGELPEQITLRGFNCWTKERYSAQTVQLIAN